MKIIKKKMLFFFQKSIKYIFNSKEEIINYLSKITNNKLIIILFNTNIILIQI